MKDFCIKSEEVIADVRSAAWLESELHPDLDKHRRHQMADICETDNVEQVWRVLGIAVAEVRLALQRIMESPTGLSQANELDRRQEWNFTFKFSLSPVVQSFLKEKVHEYLVASVMADRTAVIIPQCSRIWQERAEEARSELYGIAATLRAPYSPVRRPLWPM